MNKPVYDGVRPTLSYPPPTTTQYLTYILPHPTTTLILRPTLDYSAILPCRTSYHWIVQRTLLYPIVHPTTSYTLLFSHPSLPIYHKLLRPTLDCSAIIPYPVIHPTMAYKSSCHPDTSLWATFRIGTISRSIPYPTTSFFLLHWIVQPSYFMLPRPTTTFFVQHTGLFHPTLSYNLPQPHPALLDPTLLRPTLDCSAILPYRTLSYILPRGRMFGVLHWIVHPTPSSPYTGLFSHPTIIIVPA